MVTNILLLAVLIMLLLQMVHREVIVREQKTALKVNTDAMEDLRLTLSMCIDEVRSVQTYGLRMQK